MQLIVKPNTPRETAIEFCRRRARPLVYHQRDFYEWRDNHYATISVDAVMTEIYTFLAGALVKMRVVDGEDVRVDKVTFHPDKSAVEKVLDALKHLQSKNARVFLSDEINAPGWLRAPEVSPDPKNLIALQNVVLDLETGKTLKHSPEFFTTTALPFDYDSTAQCPRWKQFTAELFQDAATHREFQKAFGYMLSSDRRAQKVFLMIGPKRSGKGTIMKLMVALLGRENTVSPDLNELKETFGKQQLINKKAAFFTDERLRGDTTSIVRWLLKLSGEDDVSIPRKNRQNWLGRPAVRIWIATNETPAFDDASAVIADRFIVFRLTQSFSGREDVDLIDKLTAERPGILNWAREGLRMLREDGAFKPPAQTEADAQRMRDISSPALAFARERLTVDAGLRVDRDELYSDYEAWCKKNGHKSQSRAKFVNTLMDEYPGLKEGRDGPRGSQVPVLRGMGWQRDGAWTAPAHDDVMSARLQVVEGGRK